MRRDAAWLAAALLLATGGWVSAQTAVQFGRVEKLRFKSLVSPIGSFEVEYPNNSDWVVLPGPTGAVLELAEHRRRDASIVIERQSLRMALTEPELDIAASREAAAVRTREADTADLNHRVLHADQRYILIVEYTRPGIYGRERVVHYGVLQGAVMYRVICRATETTFAKYAAIFGHVAASIRPAPAAPVKDR